MQHLQIIEWGETRDLLIEVKQGIAPQDDAQQNIEVVVHYWFQEQVTAFKKKHCCNSIQVENAWNSQVCNRGGHGH
jgi:hypothetical protein